MKLTNKQILAKKHLNGPALILAVPGAGKTTVLLNRILYLIKEHNIQPKKILSITFSKTQAEDMKYKFNKLTENLILSSMPMFSTIHSFSYYIIRYYLSKTKKILTVIENSKEYNKYMLIKKLYYAINNSYISDAELELFFTKYSYIKNSMINIDEFNEHLNIENFNIVFEKYEEFKKNNFLIDFDDMISLSYKLLLNNKNLLSKIQNQFSYIQLDEGQDTSLLQMKLIQLISMPHNNLFIVADDDQSIYSFRGANPDNILNLKKYYKDINVFYIEENHRSTKDIVKISNLFIKKNKQRYDKNIFTKKKSSLPITLVKCRSIKSQYNYIIKSIKTLQKTSNYKNFAILFRNNMSSIGLVKSLNDYNLLFVNKKNKNLLNQNKIILDVLNIIAFSENQTSIDLFEKIYYKLNSYIKKDSLKLLNTYNPNTNIFDRLKNEPNINDFYYNQYIKLKKDFRIIRSNNIPQSIDYIFSELGYMDYIIDKSYLDNDKISINYIIELLKFIFDDCKDYNDMISKLNELNHLIEKSIHNDSNIIISTVHQSKGLEYDVVFIIDLVDGEFPMKSSSLDSKERSLELEEERRLFYVAITRAKYKLYLVSPTKRNFEDCKQSRFYTEIKNIN